MYEYFPYVCIVPKEDVKPPEGLQIILSHCMGAGN